MKEHVKSLLEMLKPKVGDTIRVRYGTESNQDSDEGVVTFLDEKWLILHQTNIILLDDIRSLSLMSSVAPRSFVSDEPQPVPVPPKPSDFRITRKLIALPPAQPYNFVVRDWLEQLKRDIGSIGNSALKNKLTGAYDSFDSAVKNNDLAPRYHDLRARILIQWNNCGAENEYAFWYLFVGVLAVVAKDYAYAMEPLIRAKQYSLAAYAAASAHKTEEAEVFTVCSLLSGETNDINRYIAEICKSRHDVEVLSTLLESNKDNDDACERVAACAYSVFLESGGKLKSDIEPYKSAYETAKQLLDSVPEDMKKPGAILKYWNEYRRYTYPKPETETETNSGERLTGKIYKYEAGAGKCWGFISSEHFFHIKQVNNNTEHGLLLRKMLYAGLWNQLEVSFLLGVSRNRPNQSAASHIELTEAGAEEAQRRLSDGEYSGAQGKGFIESFYINNMRGRIQSEEDSKATYYFFLDGVIDPWFAACLRREQLLHYPDVTFEVIGTGQAINICSVELESKYREMYDEYVTADDRQRWEEFLATQAERKKQIELPVEDPYGNYDYAPLVEWRDRRRPSKPQSFRWQANEISVGTSEIPTPDGKRKTVVNDQGGDWSLIAKHAETARQAVHEGKLDVAEREFNAALTRGGFDEAVVGDLISLYCRMDGKIEQAEQLLDKYRNVIRKDKLLNLEITVCDKKKDYAKLIKLHEEAFRRADSVSSRSHNLFRLIWTYTKLSKYEDALTACQRWETFYEQNKNNYNAGRLKNGVSNVKRYKAVCLYRLGDIQEARNLATDLIRLNPADEIAVKIIDGTLTSIETESDNQDGLGSESNALNDPDNKADVETDKDSLQSFVRYMIDQSKISACLRSPLLQGEEYTGNAEEAKRDAEMLVSGRKNRRNENITRTAGARSADLFAACKIVDQLEQRGESVFEPNYKRTLAGRAIASWGDSMILSGCMQVDTPRMAYLYAIELLDSAGEQDRFNSFNRYLRSFFLAPTGADSLANYINARLNSTRNESINTSVLEGSAIPDALMHEFMIGMVCLIASLKEFSRAKSELIKDLFNKNPSMSQALREELAAVAKKRAATSEKEFQVQFNDAVELMNVQIKNLNTTLFDIGRRLTASAIDETALETLSPGAWNCCLNSTEVRRLNQIIFAFRCVRDYYLGADFENQDNCLNRAISTTDELLNDIRNEPTHVSYDVFRPNLEQFKMRLLDKQMELYQDFQPKLMWTETLQPFRSPDGQIQIQLTVENKPHCQSAEQLSIVNVGGKDIRNWIQNDFVFNLRGGERTELSLTVTIDADANNAGSFSMSIDYSYKCSDRPQHIIEARPTKEFTFIIRAENPVELKDPFGEHIGRVMRDTSMFMGRDDEIDQIINIICPVGSGKMNYGRAIAVYGQTRTGKSSLLYHLKVKLLERFPNDVLVWDMGNIGETPINEKADPEQYLPRFLYSMLSTGRRAILNSEISELIKAENLMPPVNEMLAQAEWASERFSEYMRSLKDVLEREKKIIVLFIDEFTYLHEHIKRGTIPKSFMRFWKALLENYCIFAIIVGQDDMLEFMRENQNEFNCMEPRKLTYLDEAAAKRLIREPLERANNLTDLFGMDGAIDVIYKMTAGSAFLTIVLCSNLVKYLNDRGAYKITKGIVNDFLRTRAFGANSFLTEYNFESQIQERGHWEYNDANKNILLSIARLSQNTGDACIGDITCAGLTLDEIQTLVDRLVDRNVLVREGRDRYRIQVKLLEQWLIHVMGV